MKKVLSLSLIIAALITASFATEKKPPTFLQDMENFVSFANAKISQWQESATLQDSTTIALSVKAEGEILLSKWDVHYEYERLGGFWCYVHAAITFLDCISTGPDSNSIGCLKILMFGIQACNAS